MNQLLYFRNVSKQNLILIRRNQELEVKNEEMRNALKIVKEELPKNKKIIKVQKKLNDRQKKLDSLEEQFIAFKKQMEYEREHYLCKICFDNPREILYFPCYHLAVCKRCDSSLDECPICRQPVEHQIMPYT